MGNEYEEYVRDTFKDWAHMMLNAGADIVVASHPHVLQPMETVQITEDDGSTRTGFVSIPWEISYLPRLHLRRNASYTP